MSEIATQCMSEHDARRLTERIRIAAVNYADAKDKLMTLVQEAKDGSAHLALGCESWTGYLQEVLSGEPLRLARADRPEVAQLLSDEGMPNTVIAKTLGVDEKTIRNDLRSEYSEREPRQVTRTDGQVLTVQPRPEPIAAPAPKRRPITDQASDAGWELRKATEKLQRIFEDGVEPPVRTIPRRDAGPGCVGRAEAGMNPILSLTGLLRLAEGIPETAENKLGRFELIRGLNNHLNALEKDDDE